MLEAKPHALHVYSRDEESRPQDPREGLAGAPLGGHAVVGSRSRADKEFAGTVLR